MASGVSCLALSALTRKFNRHGPVTRPNFLALAPDCILTLLRQSLLCGETGIHLSTDED